jgi:hypothetical protein
MDNQKKVTITLPEELHEKAKEISKKIFGKPNVSGLYAYWIQCYDGDVNKKQ